YSHPSEHALRFPIGSSDRAINIFLSAQPTLGMHLEASAGGSGDERYTSHGARVNLPSLVLRDPWFALALQPTVGVDVVQPSVSGDSFSRVRLGAEMPIIINSHGPVPVMPKIGAGVSLRGQSAVPYVSGGLDVPL